MDLLMVFYATMALFLTEPSSQQTTRAALTDRIVEALALQGERIHFKKRNQYSGKISVKLVTTNGTVAGFCLIKFVIPSISSESPWMELNCPLESSYHYIVDWGIDGFRPRMMANREQQDSYSGLLRFTEDGLGLGYELSTLKGDVESDVPEAQVLLRYFLDAIVSALEAGEPIDPETSGCWSRDGRRLQCENDR